MAYNATVSRPGRNQLVGADVTELLLKVFSGEVLSTFAANTVMRGLHTIRTITSGKAAQFIITGAAKSRFHVPGESLLDAANVGNALGNEANDAAHADKYADSIANTEKTIYIDKQLVSSTFVDQLDEKLAHWDARSGYSREIGLELSKQFDINCLNTLVAASRSGANITGGPTGGSVNGGATIESDSDKLLDSIAGAAQKLDENNIPESDRSLILKPAQFWLLLNDIGASSSQRAHLVDRDVASANGDVATGKVLKAYGFDIFKSNNLPAQADLDGNEELGRKTPHVGSTGNDVYGTTSDQGGYLGNNADLVGMAFHKSAIGTVKMMDLSVRSEFLLSHLGSLLVCSYSMGHGVLRPEAAVELSKAA